MINVFDPYFSIGENDKTAVANITSEYITEKVRALAGAMGYSELTGYTVDTLDNQTATLKALDNLYDTNSSIVIPILFGEKTDGNIAAAYAKSNISYFVITPKNNTTEKTDATNEPHYALINKDGVILPSDQTHAATTYLDYQTLCKPNGFSSSANTDVKVGGERLTTYRLYRNSEDDYPIMFDQIDAPLVFGSKTNNGNTAFEDIVITSNSFSVSLIQQVISISNFKGQLFPIVPIDYSNYMVNDKTKIYAFGGTATFNEKLIAFTFSDATDDKGFAAAFLQSDSSNKIYYTRTFEEIYVLKKN